ncbi:hypothetical protein SH668x_001299 [Planctomicrobium sp. SH668]|uniref:hypothetical protein n=1 Tax=Planctomicrobium sp. SH668 TaxID=3448126 RepID=UPI003F5B9199
MKVPKDDLDAFACALLNDQDPLHTNLSIIAERCGISRRSLTRLPDFSEKYEQIKQWKKSVRHAPRRGHKGDDRSIEAYDD